MSRIKPVLKAIYPNINREFPGRMPGLLLLIAFGFFAFAPPSAPPPAPAPPSDVTNYQFKGLFCWKFIKSTEWPSDYQSGNFIIGVYGDSPIQGVLEEKYNGKTVGTQMVEIKRISSTGGIGKVHLMYVPESSSKNLGAILRALQTGNQSTMIVTEQDGLLNQGSIFNFMVVGNRVRFEINKRNAEKFHLKISSSLTDLADNVVE